MSEDLFKPGKHLPNSPEMTGADLFGDESLEMNTAVAVVQPETPQDVLSETDISLEYTTHHKFSARNFYKRAKQAAVLATVGVGVAGTATHYAPNPKVSSSGTDALIGVNNFLQDNGEAGLIAVASLGAIIAVSRFAGGRNGRVKEMLDMTKPVTNGKERHWSRTILPPLLITAAAVSTGLGAEAGRGANVPVESIIQAMGANRADTYAIVESKDVLPFNHSSVAAADVSKIVQWADLNNHKATSFYMDLGSAKNPNNTANPSSAGIVALPGELLPQITESNVTVPEGDMRVITTSQFAKKGDEITVEGKPATVVATTDTFPGLDRTSIVTPAEDLSASVLSDGESPFGVMVSGIDSQAEIDAFLKEQGIDAAAIAIPKWEKSYKTFWERSVTPISMEYTLMIAGIGSVAAGFMRTSDMLRRRKGLAIQNIIGASKAVEGRAEYLRTAIDTAKATAYAAAPTIGFMAITNSAQYGVSLEANPAGLGAGALLMGGAWLASTVTGNRMIRKMDSADEVR